MKLFVLKMYLRMHAFDRRMIERAERKGDIRTVAANRKLQSIMDRLVGTTDQIETYIRAHGG